MSNFLLPLGSTVLQSFEDENGRRIFLFVSADGDEQRWVCCAYSGNWIERRVLRTSPDEELLPLDR